MQLSRLPGRLSLPAVPPKPRSVWLGPTNPTPEPPFASQRPLEALPQKAPPRPACALPALSKPQLDKGRVPKLLPVVLSQLQAPSRQQTVWSGSSKPLPAKPPARTLPRDRSYPALVPPRPRSVPPEPTNRKRVPPAVSASLQEVSAQQEPAPLRRVRQELSKVRPARARAPKLLLGLSWPEQAKLCPFCALPGPTNRLLARPRA